MLTLHLIQWCFYNFSEINSWIVKRFFNSSQAGWVHQPIWYWMAHSCAGKCPWIRKWTWHKSHTRWNAHTSVPLSATPDHQKACQCYFVGLQMKIGHLGSSVSIHIPAWIAIANRKGQKEENTLKIPMAWWYSFISFVWKIERTNKMKICLFNLKSIYTSCCLCRAAWLAAQSQSRPGRRPTQTWASLVGGDRRERGTRTGSEPTRTKTQLPRATEARKPRRRESCGGS